MSAAALRRVRAVSVHLRQTQAAASRPRTAPTLAVARLSSSSSSSPTSTSSSTTPSSAPPPEVQPRDPPKLRLPLRGTHISYTDSGADAADAATAPSSTTQQQPVLVALHGCPGSTFDFRYLGALLEPQYRMLRLDLPGHGETPLSACPSPQPEDIAALVLEVLDALLQPQQPFIVLGHSLGAQLAVHVALQRPSSTAGLVLMASGMNLRLHRGLRPWFLTKRSAQLTSNPLVGSLIVDRTVHVYRERLGFSPRFSDTELVHSWVRCSTLDFDRHKQLFQEVRERQIPVLAAFGERDRLIEAEISQEMAAAVATKVLHCPGGGHDIPKSHAREIATAVDQWIANSCA